MLFLIYFSQQLYIAGSYYHISIIWIRKLRGVGKSGYVVASHSQSAAVNTSPTHHAELWNCTGDLEKIKEYFDLESKFVPVFHIGLKNHRTSTKLVQPFSIFLVKGSCFSVMS